MENSEGVVNLALSDSKALQRAGTTAYGSLIEAMRYFLRGKGLDQQQLKSLSHALRCEMLKKIHEDLRVIADPEVG